MHMPRSGSTPDATVVMMRDELLLGVDIGTSYSKGVVTTPDGVVVARASRAHDVSMPQPGWAEHDADGVWWTDLCAITNELQQRRPGAASARWASAAWGRPSSRSTSEIARCDRPSSTASTRVPARRSSSWPTATARSACSNAVAPGSPVSRSGPRRSGCAGTSRRPGHARGASAWCPPTCCCASPASTCWTTSRPVTPRRSTTSRRAHGSTTGRRTWHPGWSCRSCAGRPSPRVRSMPRLPRPPACAPGRRWLSAPSTPGPRPRAWASDALATPC